MHLWHLSTALLLFLPCILASFCGDSAIPFSFEVLPDGQPVLGCTRPACFGWSTAGQPLSDRFSFYTINGHPDGFFQTLYPSISPFQANDSSHYADQAAHCDDTYQSNSCDEFTQWTAGIAPVLNVTGTPLVLQCCSYEPIKYASDRGIATVHLGEIFAGGEVANNSQTYGFDYISNVERKTDEAGKVFYEVNVKRLPCSGDARISPIPDEMANAIRDMAVSNLSKSETPAQAHHGGSSYASANALPLPSGGGGYAVAPAPQALPNSYAVPPPAANSYATAPSYGGSVFSSYPAQGNQFSQYASANSYAVAPQQSYAQAPAYQAPAQSYQGASGASCGSCSSGAPASCCSSFFCFSGDTTVRLQNGQKKRMDELKVGDWIMSMNDDNMINTVPVEYWLHRVPSEKANFIKFDLVNGKSLKITEKHFIFKGECTGNQVPITGDLNEKAVYASEVEVGDCLYVRMGKNFLEEKVVAKTFVEEIGFYAPMTSNAKILVNDVIASCNNIYHSYSLLNSLYFHVESFRSVLSSVFTYSDDVTETPIGTNMLVQMADIVLPKNLITA